VTELFDVNLLISGFVVGLEPARSFVNINISEVIAIDQRNSNLIPIPEKSNWHPGSVPRRKDPNLTVLSS
jgi:hypothetical protein